MCCDDPGPDALFVVLVWFHLQVFGPRSVRWTFERLLVSCWISLPVSRLMSFSVILTLACLAAQQALYYFCI